MVTNNIYIKKTIVYCTNPTIIEKGRLDTYNPSTVESVNYKNWEATLDLRTCVDCRSKHGKIYLIDETPESEPPLHQNCRCEIVPMKSVFAGTATNDGEAGADFWLKYFGELPDYYVTEEDARKIGWDRGKSPAKFIPGKMITRGNYSNDDGHLPQADGRIWYEADINYYEGKRNGHRVLWSNDGLMFVTYDHYETFYEIIGEKNYEQRKNHCFRFN